MRLHPVTRDIFGKVRLFRVAQYFQLLVAPEQVSKNITMVICLCS